MKWLLTLVGVAALTVPVAAQAKWDIEQPVKAIPDTPLTGEIWGRAFTLGEASLNSHALTFSSKNQAHGWAESEVIIFIDTEEGTREWDITPDSEGMVPHVHMKFAKKGDGFPGTLMYMGEYRMKLVLTELTASQAKGKIYLALPDYKHSFLAGTFTAKVN